MKGLLIQLALEIASTVISVLRKKHEDSNPES